MRLCYICSPIKHYFQFGSNHNHCLKLAKAHAMQLAREVKALGYIPISAPLMFLGVYDEPLEREEALIASLRVLTTCHALAYRECDLIISEGIKWEVEEATLRGMEVIKL